VKATLAGATWRRSSTHAIISADLIEIGADAATKEEAIKAATDLLYIAGRTERPREVEEAVWAREETYSTGLGFGFAVPHCKSDSIAAPSLAVLKLASAVEWGSNDGLPVSVVLLLAVPKMEAAGGGSAGHMKVFATLARRLMHEEFRHLLGSAADAASMEACLKKELGIE
jgi:fructose-specific PTS system IIA-like component